MGQKVKERKAYIDVAKGLGIIFVLMSHSCGFPYWGRYFTAGYMPLFFCLSGYVACMNRTLPIDGKYLLNHKVKKLVFLYFKYNLYLLILYFIIAILDSNFTINITFIAKNIFGIFYSRKSIRYPYTSNSISIMDLGNGPLWFVTCLIISFLIFALFHSYFFRSFRNKCLVITLLTLIGGLMSKTNILLPWSLDTAFIASTFLLLGGILLC